MNNEERMAELRNNRERAALLDADAAHFPAQIRQAADSRNHSLLHAVEAGALGLVSHQLCPPIITAALGIYSVGPAVMALGHEHARRLNKIMQYDAARRAITLAKAAELAVPEWTRSVPGIPPKLLEEPVPLYSIDEPTPPVNE